MKRINRVRKEVAGYLTHVNTNTSCVDSTLRFRIYKEDGELMSRSCSWVANVDTKARCLLEGVSAMCPNTCNTCDSCVDATNEMRFTWNGRNLTSATCEWVARTETSVRCAVDGVSDACRSTCGKC